MPKKLMRSLCLECRNADATKHYSNWHYCNNPNDSREFTILRHRTDFQHDEIKNEVPKWCPFR